MIAITTAVTPMVARTHDRCLRIAYTKIGMLTPMSPIVSHGLEPFAEAVARAIAIGFVHTIADWQLGALAFWCLATTYFVFPTIYCVRPHLVTEMGHEPERTVTLGLESQDGRIEQNPILMTEDNRNRVRNQNKAVE